MYEAILVQNITNIIINEYLSNVYITAFVLPGKKYDNTLEPSSGGKGIKLNIPNITLN